VILQRLSGVTSSLLNFTKKIKHGSQIRYAIPTPGGWVRQVRRGPSRGFGAQELFHGDVAIPGTTLSGLSGLSERSDLRSGVIGSPLPPRRFHDHEVFRRSACRAVQRPPGGSHRLRRPLRVRAQVPSPVLPDRVAPHRVRAPSATSAEGSVSPGPSKARHSPSSGFLTPSTGCSPSGLADTLGPLPLTGFSLVGPFRTERPRRVAASLRPFVHGALQSRTPRSYEVESSAA
jgi:hypothetical protein